MRCSVRHCTVVHYELSSRFSLSTLCLLHTQAVRPKPASRRQRLGTKAILQFLQGQAVKERPDAPRRWTRSPLFVVAFATITAVSVGLLTGVSSYVYWQIRGWLTATLAQQTLNAKVTVLLCAMVVSTVLLYCVLQGMLGFAGKWLRQQEMKALDKLTVIEWAKEYDITELTEMDEEKLGSVLAEMDVVKFKHMANLVLNEKGMVVKMLKTVMSTARAYTVVEAVESQYKDKKAILK